MPTATARVMFVDGPRPNGNPSYGSIKLDSPAIRIGVKVEQLPLFQRGQTYTVEYKTNDRGYHNLVRMLQAAPPTSLASGPPSQAGQRAPSGSITGTDYNTGKQIAVTGITQRAVQNGQFTIPDIALIMKTIASTYDEIFSPRTTAKPLFQSPPLPAEEYPEGYGGSDDGYDPDQPPF